MLFGGARRADDAGVFARASASAAAAAAVAASFSLSSSAARDAAGAGAGVFATPRAGVDKPFVCAVSNHASGFASVASPASKS